MEIKMRTKIVPTMFLVLLISVNAQALSLPWTRPKPPYEFTISNSIENLVELTITAFGDKRHKEITKKIKPGGSINFTTQEPLMEIVAREKNAKFNEKLFADAEKDVNWIDPDAPGVSAFLWPWGSVETLLKRFKRKNGKFGGNAMIVKQRESLFPHELGLQWKALVEKKKTKK